MGDTYTRQSSYTDGDVITAAHTNDEFNQLLAAFQKRFHFPFAVNVPIAQ